MIADIRFNEELTESDPHFKPVLIVGQLKNLMLLEFSDIACKLGKRVSEETFNYAIKNLHPAPTDKCSLYLDVATVAATPLRCSRHNAPSRAHAITQLVKQHTLNVGEQTVVIVCERKDIYASACAAVRAFPLYTRKTNISDSYVADDNGDANDTSDEEGVNSTTEKYVSSEDKSLVNIEFVIIDEGKVSSTPLNCAEIENLSDVEGGIRLAARIVDTPCNQMNVDIFVDEIKSLFEDTHVDIKVIRGEKLRNRGFGGIYGVGKAATSGPALVVLSHKLESSEDIVALVGKGIVYDTGGLSMKSKTAMPGMKRDCGGAAAILGAFHSAIRLGFKKTLHAVFCLAENAVGPKATRPDDVHTLYSGRTVEINNTDAEGRLVLADGVSYAHKHLKANIILDMATLTGAQAIATGKYHGGLLTNSEEWEVKALESGRLSGDLLAPLVYTPELHFSEFASSIADMKNSVGDRNNANSSCAGLFIQAQLGFDCPAVWMHVDMAAPSYSGERATGYGVALILALFRDYMDCALLDDIKPKEEQLEPAAKRLKRGKV